ncbi:MAG: hypothetical protein B7Y41_12420 [Hydrogenophilales bacterium 28-61-23]|nr:MAG: hypothetical protein B7Y41_12420 [Hydrogenophilales bacterium 28-61-23]
MTVAGLSYEQAPPFAAPLRFFLIAPLFLLLAAGLALFLSDWQSNRWSPAALGLTHLITLGYLTMVMLGALLQILPVVLGAPVPDVRRVAWFGLLGLSIGTPSLALGFMLAEPHWLHAGMTILVAGLLPVIVSIAFGLVRSAAPHVAWPIRQAAFALVVTLTLGIALAGGLSGLWTLPTSADLTPLHAAWGLIGWILLLVIGVAYQVVPMLQITPPYPAWLSRWLTWIMLAGLLLFSGLAQPGWGEAASLIGELAICAASIGFALATLRIQARRRRKVPDVTLDFWRLGMASLILSALLFPLLAWLPDIWQERARISLGLAFLLGFAASVVSGMLYKIVPFLAWFHLKTQTGAKVGAIPNMKEMIPDKLARPHFRLHLAMLILLLPAPFLPAPASEFATSAGLLLLAAGAVRQWLNLLRARRLFLRHGGRLD